MASLPPERHPFYSYKHRNIVMPEHTPVASILDDEKAAIEFSRKIAEQGEKAVRTAMASRPTIKDVADVIADRKTIHGDFTNDAENAQRIKQILHASPNWLIMKNEQRESLELIATKIGRILAGDHAWPDHWLDIEGYARITRERL